MRIDRTPFLSMILLCSTKLLLLCVLMSWLIHSFLSVSSCLLSVRRLHFWYMLYNVLASPMGEDVVFLQHVFICIAGLTLNLAPLHTYRVMQGEKIENCIVCLVIILYVFSNALCFETNCVCSGR